jgi:hypothetical protein
VARILRNVNTMCELNEGLSNVKVRPNVCEHSEVKIKNNSNGPNWNWHKVNRLNVAVVLN